MWAWARKPETAEDDLYEIDLATGESRAVATDPATRHGREGFVARLTSTPRAYIAEGRAEPQNVWLATADGKAPRRLTALNPVFGQYMLGETRTVEWFSDDGDRLSGALLLPAGYRPGVRYPTVLWVYGGDRNTAAYKDEFGLVNAAAHNMQLLATRGYAVFAPESKLERGTPMLDIAKSILPGVSKLVELGIADPDRIGVMGHSYGMYTTLALIVQTRRFKAAVAFAGLGNLASMYGAGPPGADESMPIIERLQGPLNGTPWQARDEYIENSPFFYLDRVTTPLLVVHGEVDLVPVAQSDQTYLAMRRLEKEVVYLRYAGTGHSFVGLHNLQDYWQRLIEWFDTHLADKRAIP